MRHSTEARTTMSLSQTEKECFKSVLENVNGWSSPTAQWKRVQSLGAATEKRRAAMSMLCRGTERRLCVDDRNKRD